ncbi:Major facilitator super domain-containing protein 7 [Gonapodya sp. JEL0774]|nr:Major facilitator super domain-containing protein 7 [Gonapodya sp. JEL0774]
MVEYYNVDSFKINVFGLITAFVGVVATPAALIIQENRGLRISCLLAAGLTTSGTFLLFIGNFAAARSTSYILAVLGEILTSFSMPLTLNACTKLAGEWFGERERTTANTVANLGNPIGLGIIYLTAPAIVGDDPSQVATLNMVVFIICAAGSVLALFTRDKPPTPPTLSAAKPKENFLQGAKDALRNPQFLLLLGTFSVMVASFTTLQTFLADFLVPYGFSESDAGTVGAIFIGTGIVVALLNGILMDRIHRHKTSLKVLSFVAVVGVIMFAVGVSIRSIELVFAAAAVYGGGGFPTMPLIMELGAECTFPVGESTSTGILSSGQVLIAIVQILAVSALRKPDLTLLNGLILLCAFHFTAHVLTWFYTSESRRIVLDEREIDRTHSIDYKYICKHATVPMSYCPGRGTLISPSISSFTFLPKHMPEPTDSAPLGPHSRLTVFLVDVAEAAEQWVHSQLSRFDSSSRRAQVPAVPARQRKDGGRIRGDTFDLDGYSASTFHHPTCEDNGPDTPAQDEITPFTSVACQAIVPILKFFLASAPSRDDPPLFAVATFSSHPASRAQHPANIAISPVFPIDESAIKKYLVLWIDQAVRSEAEAILAAGRWGRTGTKEAKSTGHSDALPPITQISHALRTVLHTVDWEWHGVADVPSGGGNGGFRTGVGRKGKRLQVREISVIFYAGRSDNLIIDMDAQLDSHLDRVQDALLGKSGELWARCAEISVGVSWVDLAGWEIPARQDLGTNQPSVNRTAERRVKVRTMSLALSDVAELISTSLFASLKRTSCALLCAAYPSEAQSTAAAGFIMVFPSPEPWESAVLRSVPTKYVTGLLHTSSNADRTMSQPDEEAVTLDWITMRALWEEDVHQIGKLSKKLKHRKPIKKAGNLVPPNLEDTSKLIHEDDVRTEAESPEGAEIDQAIEFNGSAMVSEVQAFSSGPPTLALAMAKVWKVFDGVCRGTLSPSALDASLSYIMRRVTARFPGEDSQQTLVADSDTHLEDAQWDPAEFIRNCVLGTGGAEGNDADAKETPLKRSNPLQALSVIECERMITEGNAKGSLQAQLFLHIYMVGVHAATACSLPTLHDPLPVTPGTPAVPIGWSREDGRAARVESYLYRVRIYLRKILDAADAKDDGPGETAFANDEEGDQEKNESSIGSLHSLIKTCLAWFRDFTKGRDPIGTGIVECISRDVEAIFGLADGVDGLDFASPIAPRIFESLGSEDPQDSEFTNAEDLTERKLSQPIFDETDFDDIPDRPQKTFELRRRGSNASSLRFPLVQGHRQNQPSLSSTDRVVSASLSASYKFQTTLRTESRGSSKNELDDGPRRGDGLVERKGLRSLRAGKMLRGEFGALALTEFVQPKGARKKRAKSSKVLDANSSKLPALRLKRKRENNEREEFTNTFDQKKRKAVTFPSSDPPDEQILIPPTPVGKVSSSSKLGRHSIEGEPARRLSSRRFHESPTVTSRKVTLATPTKQQSIPQRAYHITPTQKTPTSNRILTPMDRNTRESKERHSKRSSPRFMSAQRQKGVSSNMLLGENLAKIDSTDPGTERALSQPEPELLQIRTRVRHQYGLDFNSLLA